MNIKKVWQCEHCKHWNPDQFVRCGNQECHQKRKMEQAICAVKPINRDRLTSSHDTGEFIRALTKYVGCDAKFMQEQSDSDQLAEIKFRHRIGLAVLNVLKDLLHTEPDVQQTILENMGFELGSDDEVRFHEALKHIGIEVRIDHD